MRRHREKTRIDDTTIPFGHLVDGCFHIVVDAALGNATQCSECFGVRVIEHFLSLRWIGRKIESATGTQLGMSHLDFAMNTTDHQRFFTPIKLEGFAKLKLKWHKSRLS